MTDLKLKPGSVFGGMLLIAGSCIGAGMLGLPVLLGLTGFFPSLILLFVSWIFMTYTGLLLIEVNGWFYERVNIISMAEKAFGSIGRLISWTLYLFLFYSLLVAYIAGSGKLFSSFLPFAISQNISGIIFVIFFGILVYFGTKVVDFSNRLLMAGLVLTYLIMIFLGISKINPSLFLHVDMKYFLLPLAVLITSFGFHNMIPSVTAYMKGDLKRTKIAILGGSFTALVIYLFWIVLIVGIVPVGGKFGLLQAYNLGAEATISLRNILQSKAVVTFAAWFSFFAIVTSFLAQSLGLMHFIADGLKVKPNYKNNWWLALLAIVPPLIFALSYPNIFFKALGFAGAYCAVIIFCIFPALMVWIGRYINKETSSYHVKGGKISLILVILFSIVIIVNQLFTSFSK
ncbi:MAG: Tyrosine-specific transport protein [Candidatus Anoxychlamydiales bacterium]|nr:Tyrosine-specific transport protein [Candidatus Anoxychlamydiales bacterium]